MTSSVLAAASDLAAGDNVGPGSGGFLAFIGLILVVIGLVVAMRHSFKTLRRNVQDGSFEERVAEIEAARDAAGRNSPRSGTIVGSGVGPASHPKRRDDAGA